MRNPDIKFSNKVALCAHIEKADLKAIDEVVAHIGINRSEFLRGAILKELILQKGIMDSKRSSRQLGASYWKPEDLQKESETRAKIASDILDALYPLRKKANKALEGKEFVKPYVRTKKKKQDVKIAQIA